MLELAIDLEGFTVGEGQDLHHDDARDPHYRVDPVIDSSTIHGMTAAMTNTGFVALPILHSIYGQPAVLPAAVAAVFVAGMMFPATVILLESGGHGAHGAVRPVVLVKQIVLNPMVLSTLIGLAWAITGLPIPAPLAAYLNIFAAALTTCALFAIGLGLSVEGVRSNLMASMALAAKTVYILAGEYKVEEPLVAATVSITTLLSVATLLGWLYALSGLAARAG